MTLEKFLSELGSKKGAPGGGAAAALTAASGAALVEMVARLNDARLKRSSGIAAKAAALRKKSIGLMTLDAQAFQTIHRAYKTRKIKPALWQRALKAGAQPPLRICELSADAAALAQKERPRTSAWLESDRKEALVLLRAAFLGGVLNVEVNLKGIRDRAYNKRLRGKIKAWQHRLLRS